ncbi:hypothetical protein 1 [Hubei sobemo-like virus 33]|uniref:hypothetical protein 1 n=1 Tax=Hubei sobemo-like virus 33 TaxID=1923220 RepID=UPI00090C3878|nr:hypothetical protein 1 [Hubei sobemo-like virus 33]APG75750.1 hypothetical protein 1 [Hubei sobemo-like virus 33]
MFPLIAMIKVFCCVLTAGWLRYIYLRVEMIPGLLAAWLIRMEEKWMDALDAWVCRIALGPSEKPAPVPLTFWEEMVYTLSPYFDVAIRRLVFIGYSLTAIFVVVLAFMAVKKPLRRTVLRLRGITFESMQPGSEFVEGAVPDFQVGIYDAGTFVDTFIGYGIRFGSLLVLPAHVIKHVKQLVIEGRTGRLGLNTSYIPSKVSTDLVYIPMTEAQWSRVGTSTAKVPKKLVNSLVSCTGRKGTSTGLLTQTDVLGIMKYSGSTISGMSGAAYYSGQTVYGMHTGVAGDYNIGVTATLIMAETRRLVLGESPTLDEMKGLNRASAAKVRSGWDTTHLMKQVDSMYADEIGWAADEEMDYGVQLTFDGEASEEAIEKWMTFFTAMPSMQRESAINLLQSYTNASRAAKGQSDEPTPITLPKDFVSMRLDAIEKRLDKITALEQRVKTLEEKIVAGVRKPGIAIPNHSPKPFPCGYEKCYKAFNKPEARMAHQVAVGHVVGESAFGADEKPTVGTAPSPVFRQRPLQKKKPSTSSRNSSSSQERGKPSTSQQQNQSDTLVSLMRTIGDLQKSLEATVGLLSATTQNSTV